MRKDFRSMTAQEIITHYQDNVLPKIVGTKDNAFKYYVEMLRINKEILEPVYWELMDTVEA